MTVQSAYDQIKNLAIKSNSLLCVGLDPSESTIDVFFNNHSSIAKTENVAHNAEIVCRFLVNETKDLVCCYKPNSAFFEAYGPEGFQALKNVCDFIRALNIPIILDVKRGDIGNTARAYAKSAFQIFNATIVTVNPYMGLDSLLPFIEPPYSQKGIFVLCCTSNPGAKDLQQKCVEIGEEITGKLQTVCLYETVAKLCQNSAVSQSSGLVIGATQLDALEKIRSRYPDCWFLCPGIGAQGGDLKKCIEFGLRQDGFGLIIPISRGICDAKNPKEAAELYKLKINEYRMNCMNKTDT